MVSIEGITREMAADSDEECEVSKLFLHLKHKLFPIIFKDNQQYHKMQL